MLNDIEALKNDFLTPAQAAPALGCDPNTIRIAARRAPEKLGFPVVVMGRRVKIPKEAFLRFMRGEREEAATHE